MKIQDLRKLNNSYINSLLDNKKINNQLAEDIIDLYLQPTPVVYQIYKKALHDYTTQPNERNDFIYSITEDILTYNLENNVIDYPESHILMKENQKVTAFEIKFSELTPELFRNQLDILKHKTDSDPFINNHHSYNYVAALYAYQNKFGDFLDNDSFNSFYREEPTFKNIESYLKDYLKNDAVNRYSSEQIQEYLNANDKYAHSQQDFIDSHQSMIDYRKENRETQTHFNHNNNISNKAIENSSDILAYLKVEREALTEALGLKQYIENNLPLIQSVKNEELNRFITKLFDKKEMQSSYVNIALDLYKGEVSSEEITSLYEKELKSKDALYYKNALRIVSAITRDSNLLSEDPNINPFLILKKNELKNSSERDFHEVDVLVALSQYDIPEKYEHLLPALRDIVDNERSDRKNNNLTNIFSEAMSNEDINIAYNIISTSEVKNLNNLSEESKRDLVTSYFGDSSITDRLSSKYDNLILDKSHSSDRENNLALSQHFSGMKLISSNRDVVMGKILESFVSNHPGKTESLLESISSIKNDNNIIKETKILLEKHLLEQDSLVLVEENREKNMFKRLRDKFRNK